MMCPSLRRVAPDPAPPSSPGYKRDRLVWASRNNIAVTGVPDLAWRYLSDFYTTLIDIRWRWNLLFFVMGFVFTWLLFASFYYLMCYLHGDLDPSLRQRSPDPWVPCVTNVGSFTEAYLFSIETMATIGYGFRSHTEECPGVIIAVMLQSVIGAGLQFALASLVVSKTRRAKTRFNTILFSDLAVVFMEDGQLKLAVRIGDLRKGDIIGAHATGMLIKKATAKTGHKVPVRLFNVPLEAESGTEKLFLCWPSLLVHTIDQHSPLWSLSREALQDSLYELIVILDGVAATTSKPFQARKSYYSCEILWGRRFAPLHFNDGDPLATGYTVNYSTFNDTYPVADVPNCSAQALARRRLLHALRRRLENAGLDPREVEDELHLLGTDSEDLEKLSSSSSNESDTFFGSEHPEGKNKEDNSKDKNEAAGTIMTTTVIIHEEATASKTWQGGSDSSSLATIRSPSVVRSSESDARDLIRPEPEEDKYATLNVDNCRKKKKDHIRPTSATRPPPEVDASRDLFHSSDSEKTIGPKRSRRSGLVMVRQSHAPEPGRAVNAPSDWQCLSSGVDSSGEHSSASTVVSARCRNLGQGSASQRKIFKVTPVSGGGGGGDDDGSKDMSVTGCAKESGGNNHAVVIGEDSHSTEDSRKSGNDHRYRSELPADVETQSETRVPRKKEVRAGKETKEEGITITATAEDEVSTTDDRGARSKEEGGGTKGKTAKAEGLQGAELGMPRDVTLDIGRCGSSLHYSHLRPVRHSRAGPLSEAPVISRIRKEKKLSLPTRPSVMLDTTTSMDEVSREQLRRISLMEFATLPGRRRKGQSGELLPERRVSMVDLLNMYRHRRSVTDTYLGTELPEDEDRDESEESAAISSVLSSQRSLYSLGAVANAASCVLGGVLGVLGNSDGSAPASAGGGPSGGRKEGRRRGGARGSGRRDVRDIFWPGQPQVQAWTQRRRFSMNLMLGSEKDFDTL